MSCCCCFFKNIQHQIVNVNLECLRFNSSLIFKISDIKELIQEHGSNNVIVTSAHRDVLRHNSQDNTSKNCPFTASLH